MASPSATPRVRRRAPAEPENGARFDRRLGEILEHATDIFCDQGYDAASMRDLSRVSGMSLAGLYHYFESKEKLLYLIQKQTFSIILDRLRDRLRSVTGAERRVRVFIQNHLEYFLANQKAMKVLSHEDDVLTGQWGSEVRAVRREYFRTCAGLIEELKRERGLEWTPAEARIAVLSLFGMVNWIYKWHDRKTDADSEALAKQMGDIFLDGILSKQKRKS